MYYILVGDFPCVEIFEAKPIFEGVASKTALYLSMKGLRAAGL